MRHSSLLQRAIVREVWVWVWVWVRWLYWWRFCLHVTAPAVLQAAGRVLVLVAVMLELVILLLAVVLSVAIINSQGHLLLPVPATQTSVLSTS